MMEISGREAKQRIRMAVAVASEHVLDGEHKQWIIDQIVRSLLGSMGYDRFRLEHPDWQEGVAP